MHILPGISPRPPRPVRLSILVVLLALGIASPAWSHAVLVNSSPKHGAVLQRAPDTAALQFNAALEASVTRVDLMTGGVLHTALTARKGEAGRVLVDLPDLAPGVYTMTYTVLARDGHVSTGSIRFTILVR